MDDVSPGAGLIGAVNTIARANGRLVGHNTDGIGFLRSWREVVARERRLSSWEPGRGPAIAIQLALAGVGKIHLINRTLPRACRLADEIQERIEVWARDMIGLPEV